MFVDDVGRQPVQLPHSREERHVQAAAGKEPAGGAAIQRQQDAGEAGVREICSEREERGGLLVRQAVSAFFE